VKKVLVPTLLSLSLAATVASTGGVALAQDGEPQRGGRLELVALNDPRTLDNSQAVDTIEYNTVAGALYEGLYHFTPEGELVAALADGMPSVSEDGLVYTFTINPGAMFAGPGFEPRAVTAADVAYGMTRALDPAPEGASSVSWGNGYLFPIKGAQAFTACGTVDPEISDPGERAAAIAACKEELGGVEGIAVIDEQTLQVTLEQPTTTFLLGLTIATSWPVPPEAVAERGEDFANRPVGAGPFQLKEWNKGSDLTLARNDGYVDPELPYLDEIFVDLAVDENTQVLRLESGQADGAYEPFSIGPVGLRTLAEAPDVSVEDSVGPRIYYLALENDGVFGNRDLRLAVAHAATRDFTAQFGDLAKPWSQLMGSATRQSDPEGTEVYPYDPGTARAYLESGGYDGTPIKIIYDVTDPYGSTNATRLRQDLEAVGFTVELTGLQPGEFFNDAVYDPARRDLSSTSWSADYPDAQDYISTNFVCGSFLNISHFCDEDIDAAFYATESMAFGPERDAALLDVQQRLIDEVAGIPVMEVTPQAVYGPRVGAMPTLATYAPFDWKRAWIRADG
jgi:peptide/nickel transport system substrate-binding protein/oligopeptide transport system substrate-binding protein